MPGRHVDFECDDPDLKDFFENDWGPHEETLIAVTYGLFFNDVCVAKFALANDRVDAQEMGATKAERAEALADIPPRKKGIQALSRRQNRPSGRRHFMEGKRHRRIHPEHRENFFRRLE